MKPMLMELAPINGMIDIYDKPINSDMSLEYKTLSPYNYSSLFHLEAPLEAPLETACFAAFPPA